MLFRSEKWGFLTPVNKKIEDYDTRTLTVTPDMVDALRHKVNGLGYSKPDVALETYRTIRLNYIKVGRR